MIKKLILVLAAALALASCGEKQIRINVFVTVNGGALNEVLSSLNSLAQESRNEEGCLGYDVFWNTSKPDQVMIVETWANEKALEAHKLTPHYTSTLPRLEGKTTMKVEQLKFAPTR